eukprot:m.1225786 g.1225786  ORF g.1225786 m.1225786 type:complete len:79 (-) comp24635_c0_seq1:1668-1904(-)
MIPSEYTVSDAPRVCVAVGDGSAWRPLLVASLTVCCLACCFRLRTVRLPWVAGALLLGFCLCGEPQRYGADNHVAVTY